MVNKLYWGVGQMANAFFYLEHEKKMDSNTYINMSL
jgi:hypothetical protein